MSRVEAHQQTLTELTELTMQVARILEARATASTDGVLGRLVSAFTKTALVVRRCILLSMWLDQNCPAAKPRAPDSAAPTPARAGETIRAEQAERVERIDFGPNPQAALDDGRFDAAIDALKATLTLGPGLDPSPAAIATRLLTPEGASPGASPVASLAPRPAPRPDG